jgi:hypothetical protein
MGLLVARIASQNCPYQTNYFEDTGNHPKRPNFPAKSVFPEANVKFTYETDQEEGYKHQARYKLQVGYAAQKSRCPKVGGLESHCRPAKDCAVWYDLVRKTPGTACTLENGHDRGICCPGLPLNGK